MNLMNLAEETAGHHRLGGQPHKEIVRGAIHSTGPFQDQNHINKEIVNPNIQLHVV